jgi:thymidylate synthase
MNIDFDLNNVFMPELGVVRTENFSGMYPVINHYIFTQKSYEPSRDGKVKEILDFKTQLINPYRRCVGGYKRNINIFFLLAEAIWIALGKKDAYFLTLFNKKISDFSDDGKTFHAPYGYRLRHWGIRTEDSFVDNLNASKGYDQVIDAIKLFSENPNTRQVVMSIWNPNFDLGYKTKDIPCNDILMLKIRNGKLITTIQNRSNDLHWGLPTNIFQFSFLTEIIAGSLGIELGTQTHNSQTLHIYEWNDIAKSMSDLWIKKYKDDKVVGNMYEDCDAEEKHIDFNFSHEIPVNRFREIEYNLQIIINNLIKISKGEDEIQDEIEQLATFSNYLYSSYRLLKIYLKYKEKMTDSMTIAEKDDERYCAFFEIEDLESEMGYDDFNWDISMLAKNFFAARLFNKMNHKYLGKL